MAKRGEQSDRDRWVRKKVFTTGEAAEICGVSQQTIIRSFDAGRLVGFRVPGSRFRRIPRESLIAFMRANEIDTAALGVFGRSVVVAIADQTLAGELGEMIDRTERLHAVVAATAFEAGLRTALSAPVTVLIDGDLPGLDPVGATRAIVQSLDRQRPKVLVLVGAPTSSSVRALLGAGAREVVAKPADAAALAQRLTELADE